MPGICSPDLEPSHIFFPFHAFAPFRLIPDMKHLFKRHEAQFFRLSLSMVQSFRLAHRWFCLPGSNTEDECSTSCSDMWAFTDNQQPALLMSGHCAPSARGRKKSNQRMENFP